VEFYKLEFDQTPNSSSFWTNRIYRIAAASIFASPYVNQSPASSRINNDQGGFRTGLSGSYQKQFDSKNLVSLSYVYETIDPTQDSQQNLNAFRALTPKVNGIGYELADSSRPVASAQRPTLLGRTWSRSPPEARADTLPGSPTCSELRLRAFPTSSSLPAVTLSNTASVYAISSRSNQLKLDLGVRYDVQNYQLLNAKFRRQVWKRCDPSGRRATETRIRLPSGSARRNPGIVWPLGRIRSRRYH
jgi:hypothetical protein